MAFPTVTTVLDNFNRANGGLGANWAKVSTGDADPVISSNTATIGGGTYATAYWTPSTFGPDSEVRFTVVSGGGGTNVWPGVRIQSPNTSGVDGYFLWYEGDGSANSFLYRKDNDVDTKLGADFAIGITPGTDALGLEMIGTSLSAKKYTSSAWSNVATRTDGTYTGAGYISLGVQGATIDDFIGGTVASGTTYTQSVSGAGAGSGAMVRRTNKVAAGSGAGVGALIKQARKTLVGSGAGSGGLTTARFYTLLLTGAGAASGAISKQINKTLTGAGAGAGTISKSVQRLLTGAGAGVGAISKQTNKVLDGAGAGVGSLIKQANKIVAGAGAASGTISKLVSKVLSGAGAGSGVLDAALGAVTYFVNLVGGGAGSGSLTKTTQRLLSGGGAGAGSLIKQINKVLAGAGAASGALNAARLYTVILSGAGAASGAITKQINKVLSGSGAGSGTISKLIQRILSGTGQAVGALVGLLGGEIPRGSVSSRNALVSRASATDGLFFSAVGRDAARYSVTSSDSEEN